MTPDLIELAQAPWLCFLLVGAGILVSFVKKLYDLEQAGTILPPAVYWQKHPYQVLLCVCSAYMLAGLWFFSGLLNAPLAILTGVASDYAFDTLRARAAGKMQELP